MDILIFKRHGKYRFAGVKNDKDVGYSTFIIFPKIFSFLNFLCRFLSQYYKVEFKRKGF